MNNSKHSKNVRELNNIIVFDGLCNLCNRAVDFIIQHDGKGIFCFASVHTATGRDLLSLHRIDPKNIDTFLLIANDRAYTKSDAALAIAKQLQRPWPLLKVFGYVPAGLRNAIYDFIARHRYRWFGKRQHCRVATGEVSERFVS